MKVFRSHEMDLLELDYDELLASSTATLASDFHME